jgi:formamidopyrimidine-DNA glycosylase
MDNAIVAGVGNIYACDALNEAKVSPFRAAKTLSKTEVERLLTAAKHVITLGVELGGSTTDGTYVHVDGMAGKYQTVSRVYDKKDQPCPNCGEPIHKEKLGGRGTYWCPNCQK